MSAITVVNYRAHLAAAGKDWGDVRDWALTVRAGKILRWSPKELSLRPAGVAIAYLEAGCPAPDETVLRGHGHGSGLSYEPWLDARARGLAAANRKPPSADQLLAERGVDWLATVRPWALANGFPSGNVKVGRPHRGAVVAYLAAHPEAVSCAS